MTHLKCWTPEWPEFMDFGNVGSVAFIPAQRPKWAVVAFRIDDEITLFGDFYSYNEAHRVARRVRLIHIKRNHHTRRYRRVHG